MKENRITTLKQDFTGKRALRTVLVFLMLVTLFVQMMPSAVFAAGAQESSRTVKLAILSDIHYVEPDAIPAEGTDARKNFDLAEQTETRMMSEIDSILGQALKDAGETDPDAMLICGDLTSNGERANSKSFAQKLKDAKAAMGSGKGIYVINGNHDINNSYAADFRGSSVANAARTQVSDFKALFAGLGYGNDTFRYYNAVPEDEVSNYGALSYAAEIADGITLIALDTGTYGTDPDARFGEAQKTAGAVSDGLLAWAVKEAKTAKAKGNLVLAMCHHGVIPHKYDLREKNLVMDNLTEEFIIPDWERVTGTLADAGVAAVLTGHSHANDIAKYTTKKGNTIYDIETAALCAYPCGWRTIDITVSESGGKKIYDFDIKTNFMEEVDGLIDEEHALIYQEKEYHDLQTYSYAKTGIQESAIGPMASYYLRDILWGIKTAKKGEYNGTSAYLRDKFPDVFTDEESIGTTAAKLIKEKVGSGLIGDTGIEQEFTVLGMKFTLAIESVKENLGKDEVVFRLALKYPESSTEEQEQLWIKIKAKALKDEQNLRETINKLVQDGILLRQIDHEGDTENEEWTLTIADGRETEMPVLVFLHLAKLSESEEGWHGSHAKIESGLLHVDLSGVPDGVDEIVSMVDKDLANEDDWNTNYNVCLLQQDLNNLLEEAAIPTLTTRLDKTDDRSTVLQIINDAYQSHAHGEEGKYVYTEYEEIDWDIDKLNEKRDHWHELLLDKDEGKPFATLIRDNIMKSVLGICKDNKYPGLTKLAQVPLSKEEDGKPAKSIFTFVPEGEGGAPTLSSLVMMFFGNVNSIESALSVLNSMNTFGIQPVTPDMLEGLTSMIAGVQESFGTDGDETPDAEFSFQASYDIPQPPVINKATIWFNTDGGSAIAPVTAEVGTKLTKPADPVREGYTFVRWEPAFPEYMPDKDLTLKAVWIKGAADPVLAAEDLIKALPDVDKLTIDDELDVLLANKVFSELTADQQAQISEQLRNKLSEAVLRIRELEKNEKDRIVVELAEKIMSKMALSITDVTPAQVNAARAAYDELNDDQKAMVDPELMTRLICAEKCIKARSVKARMVRVKARKDRKATVTWKKLSGVSGYQLRYSMSKKFSKAKTAYAGKAGITKKTVKKLKAGKKYYFKIRAYTKVYDPATGKNVKIYGKYSKVKSAKVKK